MSITINGLNLGQTLQSLLSPPNKQFCSDRMDHTPKELVEQLDTFLHDPCLSKEDILIIAMGLIYTVHNADNDNLRLVTLTVLMRNKEKLDIFADSVFPFLMQEATDCAMD